MVDETNDELVLLQFGRIGDDAFNMDVSYPFSIVQAFGICLSSFDYKIACEWEWMFPRLTNFVTEKYVFDI